MREPPAVTDFKSLMRREEGLAITERSDSVGHVIGYGRNTLTRGVSKDEAEYLLANDERACASDCETLPFFRALSIPRQGVVMSLCYELGLHGMLGFRKMHGHLLDGEWERAADELLASDYARNTETAGRAHRLAIQLREDRWV